MKKNWLEIFVSYVLFLGIVVGVKFLLNFISKSEMDVTDIIESIAFVSAWMIVMYGCWEKENASNRDYIKTTSLSIGIFVFMYIVLCVLFHQAIEASALLSYSTVILVGMIINRIHKKINKEVLDCKE